MKQLLSYFGLVILLSVFGTNIRAADLPIKQFQAGDVISAEDVNRNFQALTAAVQQLQAEFETRNTVLEKKNRALETEMAALKNKIAALEKQLAEKPVNKQTQSAAPKDTPPSTKIPAGCLKNKYAVRLSINQSDKYASIDVPMGQRITILTTQGEWYKVSTDNHQVGWIRKDQIQLEKCQ